MRAANFKMGSILPEYNNYRPQNLERNNSGTIGLQQASGGPIFKPAIRQGTISQNPHQVSAGNNIARGKGSFSTVNQEFTNWIQPSGLAQM